jgi:5-methylcytosine-specific restriction endonuclease McrA
VPFIPYRTDYKHTRIVKKKSSKSYSKPEYAKLYNSRRWRNLRNMYYKYNPLCVECKRNNIVKEGKVIDHLIPVSEGGAFYDWKNLNTLCTSCHAKKTAREVNKRIKDKKNKNSDDR